MVTTTPVPIPDAADQRVRLYGVGWAEYEALCAMRGDGSVPRITYLEGTVELISPSLDHEYIKKNLARLVEAWAVRERIRVTGLGSWTVKKAEAERGAEPDECYVLGDRRDRPDLAIEVVITSGGIDKLAVYRGLDVPEVWFWEGGKLSVWVLGAHGYAQVDTSALLPTLDLLKLARCATIPDQLDAIDTFLGT